MAGAMGKSDPFQSAIPAFATYSLPLRHVMLKDTMDFS